jgi:hypothetical protein
VYSKKRTIQEKNHKLFSHCRLQWHCLKIVQCADCRVGTYNIASASEGIYDAPSRSAVRLSTIGTSSRGRIGRSPRSVSSLGPRVAWELGGSGPKYLSAATQSPPVPLLPNSLPHLASPSSPLSSRRRRSPPIWRRAVSPLSISGASRWKQQGATSLAQQVH